MFLNLGFKSVTMDDLANEMGISKKTIYKYYENKETLIEACVINMQDSIDQIINSISNQGLNAIEENFAIKNIFKDMFKKAETSPMHQLKKYYPTIYNKVMSREACTFSECIMSNIEKGIEEKKIYLPYKEPVNSFASQFDIRTHNVSKRLSAWNFKNYE